MDVKTVSVSAMDQLSSFGEQMTKMKEEMSEKLRNLLQPAFTEFFDRHPAVTAVRWMQYTPYFNDGDPCEFSVHAKGFSLKENPEYEKDKYGEESEESGWYHPDGTPKQSNRDYYETQATAEAVKGNTNNYYTEKLAQLNDPKNKYVWDVFAELDKFDSVPEEVYQGLGEGLVVVTREGIDVLDYDHD